MSAQPDFSRHLISVNDYYRMAEAGIFTEDQHIELINGEIFDMPPIGSFHADIINTLTRVFYQQINDNIRISVQNPIRLSDLSEPEPDIALVKNKNYRLQHPTADDVLLLIEVADSSLHYDRTIKLPQYASHQIPEVWLFNLKEQRLDIYQQPDNDYYRLHLRPKAGESIQPLLVDSVNVDWSGLFDY
jgi:Uma2 family endonuclease